MSVHLQVMREGDERGPSTTHLRLRMIGSELEEGRSLMRTQCSIVRIALQCGLEADAHVVVAVAGTG